MEENYLLKICNNDINLLIKYLLKYKEEYILKGNISDVITANVETLLTLLINSF